MKKIEGVQQQPLSDFTWNNFGVIISFHPNSQEYKQCCEYPFVMGRSGGLERSSVAPLLAQLLLALPTDCPLGDTVGVCMPISFSCTPCSEVKRETFQPGYSTTTFFFLHLIPL